MSRSETEIREEIDLLGAVAAGDNEAFRLLYARYSRALFSLAIRLVGDAGTAEEALQDAFVKIWSHAATYDSRKSRPFTWAVTILRRVCIDSLRRQHGFPRTVPLSGDDSVPSELFIRETTRHTTEIHEITDLLQVALHDFSPPQRTALEFALFSTLTHPEIAERLSQPVGTVKTWIRRGLLELHATLSKTIP